MNTSSRRTRRNVRHRLRVRCCIWRSPLHACDAVDASIPRMHPMDLEIQDRAFLITGGTDGLGLALAQRLVAEGALVAVCGRDEERLARAQVLLGLDALCSKTDVTNAEQLDEFIDATLTRFGRLDGAVNNAGRSAGGPIATSDDAAWRSDYELKVIAALHLARQVLPALETTKGAIVNVAGDPGAHTEREHDADVGVARGRARAHQGARQRGRSARHSRERHPHRPDRVGTVGASRRGRERVVRGVLRDDGGELEDPVGPRRSRRGVRGPGDVLTVTARRVTSPASESASTAGCRP